MAVVPWRLAILTTVIYLAWLGWDQRYDVSPAGVVSGPYEPWQIAGLVTGLAALAAFAGWRRRPHVGIAVVPLVMTLCFSIDAATDSESYGASLWPIAAALVGVATLVGVTLVAGFASLASWRPSNGR